MRIELKEWKISSKKVNEITSFSPCTVLSSLLENGVINDPYFRANELVAREYLNDDYKFESIFYLNEENLDNKNILFLDGLCTIADVYINDVLIIQMKDMHQMCDILLDNSLLKQENKITIFFKNPYQYIKEYKDDKKLFETYAVTDKDSPKIRQANYMFGWDWGPNLADIGLTRDIYILSTKVGYLKSFRHSYNFINDNVDVNVEVDANIFSNCDIFVSLSGNGFKESKKIENRKVSFEVKNPELWYPTGFGKQPLYDLKISIRGENETLDYKYKIGIRDVKIDDSFDEYGRNFAVYVNDKKIFLKGSNYIPEDNIIPFTNKDRTKRLLNLAKSFNHNIIRVWGGGYYPNDVFYETCDELGLLVFQDLMFACASYNIDDNDFRKNIIKETEDNLKRIRHHASIILIAGNNEIEDGVRGHGFVPAIQYIEMFHHILKDIVNKETDFYYLTSSPTSGDPYFSSPNDDSYLDTHYWWVWGNDYPFENYLTIKPRLLSEFGCQSLPLWSSICRFTNKKDRTINSDIMKFHQKDPSEDNSKIIRYTESLFQTKDDLKTMCYLSMLTQAEGIKLCVENLRGNKYRCNGAIYWQLNDCWPTQSHSSIDYYFGLKALHYYSKRFYNPHLILFKKDEVSLLLNVSNDTDKNQIYVISCALIDKNGLEKAYKTLKIEVDKYSSKDITRLDVLDGNRYIGIKASLLNEEKEIMSENTYLFKKDRDIAYQKANITLKRISDNEFEISTDRFARGVYLCCPYNEVVFSDNFFNLSNGENKKITSSSPLEISDIEVICVNNL